MSRRCHGKLLFLGVALVGLHLFLGGELEGLHLFLGEEFEVFDGEILIILFISHYWEKH